MPWPFLTCELKTAGPVEELPIRNSADEGT